MTENIIYRPDHTEFICSKWSFDYTYASSKEVRARLIRELYEISKGNIKRNDIVLKTIAEWLKTNSRDKSVRDRKEKIKEIKTLRIRVICAKPIAIKNSLREGMFEP